MFIKCGDPNPITVIDPVDVDSESTKKSLKKTIKAVKDLEEKIVAAPVPETKVEVEKK